MFPLVVQRIMRWCNNPVLRLLRKKYPINGEQRYYSPSIAYTCLVLLFAVGFPVMRAANWFETQQCGWNLRAITYVCKMYFSVAIFNTALDTWHCNTCVHCVRGVVGPNNISGAPNFSQIFVKCGNFLCASSYISVSKWRHQLKKKHVQLATRCFLDSTTQ